MTAFAAAVTTAEIYVEHYRASFGNGAARRCQAGLPISRHQMSSGSGASLAVTLARGDVR
jgi:hypothetical protein